MVKARIDSGKHGAGGLFHHIGLHQKVARLAHDKLTRLEPKLQFTAVFFAKETEALSHLSANFFYLSHHFVGFVRHLKATTEVHKFKIGELARRLEKEFCAAQEHVCIQNVGSGMHV